MRAIVQRVLRASVEVDAVTVGAIERGLLVYLGVAVGDHAEDAIYLAEKVRFLRVFEDGAGKMNLDVAQAQGNLLVVSAFTVQADARKGRRPSFDSAAQGDDAQTMYGSFCDALMMCGLPAARGVFGADMKVHSINDGPVCILLDSQRTF
jgi:D-tyrosyl-tRNA(Tyr) deacylase